MTRHPLRITRCPNRRVAKRHGPLAAIVVVSAMIAMIGASCANPNGPDAPNDTTVVFDGVRYRSIPTPPTSPAVAFADTLALTDATAVTDTVLTGVCLPMQAYTTPDRIGRPVYDQAQLPCITLGLIVPLTPGARRAFGASLSRAELKSAHVARGHYWLTVSFWANNKTVRLAAGDGEFTP